MCDEADVSENRLGRLCRIGGQADQRIDSAKTTGTPDMRKYNPKRVCAGSLDQCSCCVPLWFFPFEVW